MERVNKFLFASASLALLMSWSCTGKVSTGGTKSGGTSSNPNPPGATQGSSGGSTGANIPPGPTGTGTTTTVPDPNATNPVPPAVKPVVTVPANAPANPGYVVVRRLNQPEYNNTVADLLGTKLTPATDFPADDLGAEFDTVGSALSLAPEYVSTYETAANNLIADLFADATRQKNVVTCDVTTGGDACAKTILTAFARKAWRRPTTADEVTALMVPMTTAKTLGLTPVDGIKAALTGVLLSPFFIYKLEMDPNPLAGPVRRLNAYELATRLSYSLWSTMPDATLSAAADAGQLTTDDQVAAQVTRMLADPKADTMLDNFAAKWLDTGNDSYDFDAKLFPKYTPALGLSMKGEARRYMQEFLHNPLNVTGMIDSRFTFVDANLATFYGLTRTGATNTTDFVKVDTTGTQREGLLTLGAFLMTTSYTNRTSPVRRGEYVFRRVMCDAVPDPPPNVPMLSETVVPGQTLRQRLEAHRAKPECSPCHNLMDPIGFGLENYDAIGAYRTMDSGAAVDSKGMLTDGTMFSGAVELGGILAKDPRLPQCVTEKFMTFAIGRLMLQPDDGQWIGYLSAKAQATDGSLPSIIRSVVMSDAFRSRQPGVQM
jgi:hypothetical protein